MRKDSTPAHIAHQGDAEVIVMAACGERANEVVEIFTDFPQLIDLTRAVADGEDYNRCNTSNMPVTFVKLLYTRL